MKLAVAPESTKAETVPEMPGMDMGMRKDVDDSEVSTAERRVEVTGRVKEARPIAP